MNDPAVVVGLLAAAGIVSLCGTYDVYRHREKKDQPPVRHLVLPQRAMTRDECYRFVEPLPIWLDTITVVIDCQKLVATTAEFMDEMVKIILDYRRAKELILLDPSLQFTAFARNAAGRRGVEDRLSVQRDIFNIRRDQSR